MSPISILLITCLLTYVGFTSITNISSINKLTNDITSIIKDKYELEEMDAGKYEKILLYKVLPFSSKVYKIKDLGTLCFLTLNTGVMEILSVNINAFTKDIPQLTIDFVSAFNSRTLLIEIYNLQVNKDNEYSQNFLKELDEIEKKYYNLKEAKASSSWYDEYLLKIIGKKGNVINDKYFLNIIKEIVEAYVVSTEKAPKISPDDQKKIVGLYKEFSNNLVEKGGVAINNFIKSLGKEKTAEFLSNVFYGYSQYMN